MPQDAEPPDVRRICLYAASTHRNGREIASLADYQLGHVRGCPQGRRTGGATRPNIAAQAVVPGLPLPCVGGSSPPGGIALSMTQRFPCSARFALYRSLEVTRVLRLGEPPGHEYRREVSDKEHDRSVVQERSAAEAWRELHNRPQRKRSTKPERSTNSRSDGRCEARCARYAAAANSSAPPSNARKATSRVSAARAANASTPSSTPAAIRPCARRSRAGWGRLNRGGLRLAAAGSERSAPGQAR